MQESAAAVLEPLVQQPAAEPLVRKPAVEQEMREWEQLLEPRLIKISNFS